MYTPLYEIIDGVYHQRFKVGSKIYSRDTEFNITQGKSYTVKGTHGLDVEIINDLGELEIYSDEYFSVSKINAQ